MEDFVLPELKSPGGCSLDRTEEEIIASTSGCSTVSCTSDDDWSADDEYSVTLSSSEGGVDNSDEESGEDTDTLSVSYESLSGVHDNGALKTREQLKFVDYKYGPLNGVARPSAPEAQSGGTTEWVRLGGGNSCVEKVLMPTKTSTKQVTEPPSQSGGCTLKGAMCALPMSEKPSRRIATTRLNPEEVVTDHHFMTRNVPVKEKPVPRGGPQWSEESTDGVLEEAPGGSFASREDERDSCSNDTVIMGGDDETSLESGVYEMPQSPINSEESTNQLDDITFIVEVPKLPTPTVEVHGSPRRRDPPNTSSRYQKDLCLDFKDQREASPCKMVKTAILPLPNSSYHKGRHALKEESYSTRASNGAPEGSISPRDIKPVLSMCQHNVSSGLPPSQTSLSGRTSSSSDAQSHMRSKPHHEGALNDQQSGLIMRSPPHMRSSDVGCPSSEPASPGKKNKDASKHRHGRLTDYQVKITSTAHATFSEDSLRTRELESFDRRNKDITISKHHHDDHSNRDIQLVATIKSPSHVRLPETDTPTSDRAGITNLSATLSAVDEPSSKPTPSRKCGPPAWSRSASQPSSPSYFDRPATERNVMLSPLAIILQRRKREQDHEVREASSHEPAVREANPTGINNSKSRDRSIVLLKNDETARSKNVTFSSPKQPDPNTAALKIKKEIKYPRAGPVMYKSSSSTPIKSGTVAKMQLDISCIPRKNECPDPVTSTSETIEPNRQRPVFRKESGTSSKEAPLVKVEKEGKEYPRSAKRVVIENKVVNSSDEVLTVDEGENCARIPSSKIIVDKSSDQDGTFLLARNPPLTPKDKKERSHYKKGQISEQRKDTYSEELSGEYLKGTREKQNHCTPKTRNETSNRYKYASSSVPQKQEYIFSTARTQSLTPGPTSLHQHSKGNIRPLKPYVRKLSSPKSSQEVDQKILAGQKRHRDESSSNSSSSYEELSESSQSQSGEDESDYGRGTKYGRVTDRSIGSCRSSTSLSQRRKKTRKSSPHNVGELAGKVRVAALHENRRLSNDKPTWTCSRRSLIHGQDDLDGVQALSDSSEDSDDDREGREEGDRSLSPILTHRRKSCRKLISTQESDNADSDSAITSSKLVKLSFREEFSDKRHHNERTTNQVPDDIQYLNPDINSQSAKRYSDEGLHKQSEFRTRDQESRKTSRSRSQYIGKESAHCKLYNSPVRKTIGNLSSHLQNGTTESPASESARSNPREYQLNNTTRVSPERSIRTSSMVSPSGARKISPEQRSNCSKTSTRRQKFWSPRTRKVFNDLTDCEENAVNVPRSGLTVQRTEVGTPKNRSFTKREDLTTPMSPCLGPTCRKAFCFKCCQK